MIRRRDFPPLLTPLLTGCGSPATAPIRIGVATNLLETYLIQPNFRLYARSGGWSRTRMPPDAPAGVLRYVAVTNEKVRNAKIALATTYTNEFVDEARR